VVAECLANVAKSASATGTTVAISSDRILAVDVIDDGIGGADAANGTGIRGLLDRMEAVGGRLIVESPAGGTVVRAEVPAR
jgi:signal transduction histidine kinase